MALTFAGDAFTVDDLDALPDDGRRYELIGGAIVMTPAPSPAHQRAVWRLGKLIEPAVPPDHELLVSPVDLDLPPQHHPQRVQPDLVVVPLTSVGHQRLSLPVSLVVEIVSAGSRTNDYVTKRAAYAAAGIPAYWVVDLPEARIICCSLGESSHAYETYAEGPQIEVAWPTARHTITIDVEHLAAPAGT